MRGSCGYANSCASVPGLQVSFRHPSPPTTTHVDDQHAGILTATVARSALNRNLFAFFSMSSVILVVRFSSARRPCRSSPPGRLVQPASFIAITNNVGSKAGTASVSLGRQLERQHILRPVGCPTCRAKGNR